MTLERFLELAKMYADFGWAIQEQLHAITQQGEGLEEQNSNALRYILGLLNELDDEGIEDAAELRDEIAEYLASPLPEGAL